MTSYGWTIAVARAICDDFADSLEWPNCHSSIRGMGFAIRGPKAIPALVVQWSPKSQHLIEPIKLVPSTFAGFPIVSEFDESEASSALSDRVIRAFRGKPKQAWPGWPGSAVFTDGLRKGGTLGCFVKELRRPFYHALTCEHVLSNSAARAPAGAKVYTYVPRRKDPHKPEAKAPTTLLGTVAPAMGGLTAEHDCTLVKLHRQSGHINVIPAIGRLSTETVDLDKLKLGDRVCKYGAASGFTVGLISGVQNIRQVRGDGVEVISKGVAEVTPEFDGPHRFSSFCYPGDSGAVVTAFDRRSTDVPALGLLVARATLLHRGYFIGLKPLLERLTVQLC